MSLLYNNGMITNPIIPKVNSLINHTIPMTKEEIVCYYLIVYVLQSHKELSKQDVEFMVNYIVTHYSINYFTYDQIIMFIVYCNKRGTCKFALLFNDSVDNAIRTRNIKIIDNLITEPKEKFIELYNNEYLTTEEKSFLLRMLSYEFYTFERLFDKLKEVEINKNNIINFGSDYYNEVCIYNSNNLENDVIIAEVSKFELTSNNVFTIDKPDDSLIPYVYCFDLIELLDLLTNEIPYNPKSGKPFSSYTIRLVTQRFHKELAMYRKYKDLKTYNIM